MNKNNLIQLALLLIALLLSSCEKDESETSISKIAIENYSKTNIDSLYVRTSSKEHWYNPNQEPLVFRNLKSGSTSEILEKPGLEIALHFKAYIAHDSIRKLWYFPNTVIDPTGSIYVPPNHYLFGIVECDTANGIMEIGLMDVFYRR